MSTILSPTAVAAAEVDINKAVRVVQRPLMSATLGEYACSLQSGLMAAGLAANAPVWSCRYTGANLCVVDRVLLDGLGTVLAFAAGVVQLRLFIVRAYTVFDTLATAATLSGNNCKLRSSYATTAMGNIAIAATATGTHGTGANDVQPMGAVVTGLPAVAGQGFLGQEIFGAYSAGHPIILAANEGLELQATVPATGTWTFGVDIHWAEVTSAEWQ